MSGWFLACQKWCHLSLFLPPFPRIRIRFPSSLSCYTRRFYRDTEEYQVIILYTGK